MRWLRYALCPAGLAFGVAAEWIGQPQFIAFDAAAGFALLFLGLVTWSRRPSSRSASSCRRLASRVSLARYGHRRCFCTRLRRYYRLTPAGSARLAAEAARLQANAAVALARLNPARGAI